MPEIAARMLAGSLAGILSVIGKNTFYTFLNDNNYSLKKF